MISDWWLVISFLTPPPSNSKIKIYYTVITILVKFSFGKLLKFFHIGDQRKVLNLIAMKIWRESNRKIQKNNRFHLTSSNNSLFLNLFNSLVISGLDF